MFTIENKNVQKLEMISLKPGNLDFNSYEFQWLFPTRLHS